MTLRQRRLANALTWVFALATATALLTWLSERVIAHRPHQTWAQTAFWAANIPMTPSIASITALAILTVGLVRHKRVALLAVVAMQVLGGLWALAELVPIGSNGIELPDLRSEAVPLSITSVVIAAISVPALLRLLPAFSARIPKGSWRSATLVLLSGLILVVLATHLFMIISPGTTGPAWQQTVVALLHAVGLPAPSGWHGVQVGRLMPQVSSLIMGTALLATVLIFLRSARSSDEWTPEKEIGVRRLLASDGEDDSLGYYATRRDKLLHFAPDGSAAVAYRVVAGVCLASGDPVGPQHAWPRAISAWEAYARQYGWVPAVLGCGAAGARSYAANLGFDVLRLGDEAILSPERFHLDSTTMTELRRVVRRARREGLHSRIAVAGDLDAAELARLGQAADRWREGRIDRGFSMALGRFGDPADARTLVVTVYDASSTLIALQTFVPWGRRGLSLDLMRRSPDAPNGTNEFLTAELMAWASDHGIARISLNFAAFRHVFAEAEDVAAAPLTKVNSQVLGLLDRFLQLQRLYRANAKYNPAWQPRYLALASTLSIPQVGLACMIAEGFLPSPAVKTVNSDAQRLSTAQLEQVRELASPPPPEVDWARHGSDQTRNRLRHLAELTASGRPGYPVGSRAAVPLASLADPLAEAAGRPVSGRIRSIRFFGGVCFADLVDRETRVQLVFDAARLGRTEVAGFARLADSGDLIEVRGVAGRSRSGTPSLLVDDWTMLAKALHPVPWQGLEDPEIRLRKRSLDLLVHPDAVVLLQARSRVIQAVRETLTQEGYLEVETPVLATTNGGASARPFHTHINAYDAELVLRIAPELALKRLVVGGMGRVFEIARNFRNEGADATHNPEFTAVEAYAPFCDYTDMRLLTQRIVQAAAVAVHGRAMVPLDDGSGTPVLTDIDGDWAVVEVCAAVSAAAGRDVDLDTDLDELLGLAREHEVAVRDGMGPGAVIEELYGELVEKHTTRPTFYVDFPAETSPLTAPHRSKPGLVERWDLVIGGMELGTAYSELTDPLVQRARLVEQSWKAALGDPEAMEVDEDFLAALELGMPPTGGLGIGLDRLVMAITGTSIRQVLAFPFMRPL